MTSSNLVLTVAAMCTLLSALSGVVLAAPTPSSERSLTPSTASSSWTGDAPRTVADDEALLSAHRRRRHRRSSLGGRHHGDVDALRRLLFGLRPLQDHDVDFGGLEVRDLFRGGDGGVAALTRDVVLLPLTGYDDEPDDGADDGVLSAIVTAPRRTRCPPGERYYERRCRKVWR
ncbi:uncharacterized protein LOC113201879 [Frankliniella occidentalis]|uniref:Uncharacterized protein LOC113201879 n=1 Tax=Frankliniella occidentalis TaxID=133901 RepID=A0A6J1RRR6_FRAOC|nr:uncharacterized protein LOC113201879 [Frankliniella occidentalis]